MLFSRIAMDIAPYEVEILESNFWYILLAAIAIQLLIFAVVFSLIRRKRAKAREARKQTQEQGKRDPGQ